MTALPELHSQRLRLIAMVDPTFDANAAYLAPNSPSFIGATDDPDALWWSVAMIAGHWHLRGYGHFAVFVRETGENVGLVGPWFPKGWPEPELAWHLVDGSQGNGYATEAATCVLDWLFTVQNWPTVISMIDDNNAESLALIKRLQAKPEGLFQHRLAGELRIWRHAPGPHAAHPASGVLQ